MKLQVLICFWIVAIATAVTSVGCGGGNDRTRINKRGGGNGDSTTLTKLKVRKCGTNDREILDMESLGTELDKIDHNPSHLYFRKVNSYDHQTADIPSSLGSVNDDERFGIQFFDNHRIGLVTKKGDRIVDESSLLSFETNAEDCTKVTITFDKDFFAYKTVIKDLLDGDNSDVKPSGETGAEIEFSVDVALSNKDQLVLKGPDDMHIVYTADRGKSEVSILFVAMVMEDICGNRVKHVLEAEQIFTWDDKLRLSKPYVSDIRIFLKDAKIMDNGEEEKDYFEFDPAAALLIYDEEVNQVNCSQSTGTPADDTPADDNPTDDTPADDNPTDDTPTDDTPTDDTPTDDTPTDDTPTDDTPTDDTPTDDTPTDDTTSTTTEI